MNRKFRRSLSVIAIIFSIIYLCWRTFFTLPFGYGALSVVAGICLLLAEIIGIISGTEQLVVSDEHYIPKLPELSDEKFPDVDVFIATHNEPVELLYKTINGCKNMDYPDKKKVHIYICDDKNREEMNALALKMGVGYFGMEENDQAKAGNLNNALGKTNSPLIATFDADMIPLHTFLLDTVPYFFLSEEKGMEEEKIGFIQTPQSFYNPDLFQYNLYSEDSVPNEQDFFFKEINVVRNRTNTPIYAGSNTLISREALEKVGGIATGLITEDFATGIRIQREGYICYATNKVEANGLAPNDLKSLIKQRERWARGCIQTLKSSHIIFMRGFKIKQKKSYINSLLYWYNPFCRLMYIIAPILFGLFDIYVLNYAFMEMIYIWAPYFITYNLAIKFVSGNIRNSRLSNIYDTIMFLYLIIPILLETLGIKKKKFVVTKKDNSGIKKSTFKYAVPHIIAALFSGAALIRCISIAIKTNSSYYIVVICWLAYNLYFVIMSIFFVLGRKIERRVERFIARLDVEIECKYGKLYGKTIDISENGISVKLDFPEYINIDDTVKITCKSERKTAVFEGTVIYTTKVKHGFKYAFELTSIDEINKSNYYNIVYDRIPTLPSVIEEKASVFGEISSNIHRRFEKYTYNSRRLVRIDVDRNAETINGDKIKIYNFNYDYILIGYKKLINRDKIEINIGKDIVIKAVPEKNKKFEMKNKKKAELFRITNLEEFINNKDFRPILNKWIEDYREKCKIQEQKKKNEEKSDEDQLDEFSYVWRGDEDEDI